MDSGDYRLLIRGAGELASATAGHLFSQGFTRILMLERRYPKAIRRQVCFSEAILDGRQTIQGIRASFARNLEEVERIHAAGEIAVSVMGLDETVANWQPDIFIEAAMLRIKNYAAPANAMRLDCRTPCVETARCADCRSPGRICNSWVITERSYPKGRITVVLINADLGL